jgi:hypothetical protein
MFQVTYHPYIWFEPTFPTGIAQHVHTEPLYLATCLKLGDYLNAIASVNVRRLTSRSHYRSQDGLPFKVEHWTLLSLSHDYIQLSLTTRAREFT